jgi:sigma-B regulation protein RsbU (phosphoserine phosphatase)
MAQLPLPPPAPAPSGGRLSRGRAYLVGSWFGRILAVAVLLAVLDKLGVPLPCGLDVVAWCVLWVYAAWGLFRLSVFLVRRLLWRIRTKMIVSYLFIAVVPVVLLLTLFVLAAILSAGLVVSHIVFSEVDGAAQRLRMAAESALAALPSDDAAVRAGLEPLLAPARRVHPDLSYALLRKGRVVATVGSAPASIPGWVGAAGFSGLAKQDKDDDEPVLRTVQSRGADTLVLDAPVDRTLFGALEQRMGLHFIASGGSVRKGKRGLRIKMSRPPADGQTPAGISWPVTPETRRWDTGEADLTPMMFRFHPFELVSRLAPGTLNMGDILVKVLAGVAGVFLVLYVVALLLGLLLARSITKNVHELSRGTERLRRGDFSRPIPIQSRDQLGELAESFNLMARSVQDLLMEQAEKQRLEEELRIARQIQMSLLPQAAIGLPGLRVAALCLPAAEVGGDYYDLLPLSDTRLGVLVADVSGKGTSAALYMAELKGLVLSLSRMYDSPARLLSEANRILAANMDARSFITMTYAVLDTAAGAMRYARAGHNPILQFEAATGRTRALTPPGLGLGIDSGDRFDAILEEAEVPLRPGDLFLFFTDGLSEAMNERAELFGETRLRQVIESADSAGQDEGALKERILAAVREFVGGAAQHDDMTLVILKVV